MELRVLYKVDQHGDDGRWCGVGAMVMGCEDGRLRVRCWRVVIGQPFTGDEALPLCLTWAHSSQALNKSQASAAYQRSPGVVCINLCRLRNTNNAQVRSR